MSSIGRVLILSVLVVCGVLGVSPVSAVEPIAFTVTAGVASIGEEGAYDKVVRDSIDVVLQRNDFLPAGFSASSDAYVWEYTILALVPRLHLSLTVLDRQRGVIVASATNRARANLTLYASVDALIAEVIDDVRVYHATVQRSASGIVPIPIAGTVTIPRTQSGDDEVVVQPIAPLGTSGDTIVFADGVVVPGLVSRPQAYARSFFLSPTPQDPETEDESPTLTSPEDALPQPAPYRRLGVQLHYSYARFVGAGLGVRYFVLPDRLYASQETDLHFTTPAVPDAATLTHLEGRFMTGAVVLGGPATRLAMEVSTGIGGTVTLVSGGSIPPYYDWYWNVFNIGGILRTGRQSWFLRSGVNYGFETERGFFVDGLNEDNFNPQLYLGTIRSW